MTSTSATALFHVLAPPYICSNTWKTLFLREEAFFLLLFLETCPCKGFNAALPSKYASFSWKVLSCSMNQHIHMLSLVTVSFFFFFTLLLPPIHPAIHQYIHPTIRLRTETQVQLYCPVYGEHAVKAFAPSLLLLASYLHILTPLCVVPTSSCLFFQVLIRDALVTFTKHSLFKQQSVSLKH